MQFLLIDKNDTLESISRIAGQNNADFILVENSITRTPNVGKAWEAKCNDIINASPNLVTAARKSALLNGLTNSQEVFEKACLMDEDEWKIFSSLQAFKDALRIPETIKLPYSAKVIGSNASVSATQLAGGNGSDSDDSVSSYVYRAVMLDLKEQGNIDPSIFNKVNTSPSVNVTSTSVGVKTSSLIAFNLPWGKIQMYSDLLKETVDFPVYPETLTTGRTATYTTMPDTIYQYEPWIVYQNSGPREQSILFHMHRDMWSGNHLDGKANELIRFCEANTFPKYVGSTVQSPTVRLYIDGSLFIAGVLVSCSTEWGGPIGQDNWYLEFSLSLTIQEVSDFALNIDTVRNLGLKGS